VPFLSRSTKESGLSHKKEEKQTRSKSLNVKVQEEADRRQTGNKLERISERNQKQEKCEQSEVKFCLRNILF